MASPEVGLNVKRRLGRQGMLEGFRKSHCTGGLDLLPNSFSHFFHTFSRSCSSGVAISTVRDFPLYFFRSASTRLIKVIVFAGEMFGSIIFKPRRTNSVDGCVASSDLRFPVAAPLGA